MCEPNERGSDGDAGYPPGPVILLGRGGSGTRLLSAFASQNGIFLGNMLNTTRDSVEWVPDLYELASESTAAGVVAGSARDAYWRGRLRRTAAQILGAAGLPFDAAWGWKLPEIHDLKALGVEAWLFSSTLKCSIEVLLLLPSADIRNSLLFSAQIRRSRDGLLRFWPLILGVASVKPRDIFEEARKKPKATISLPTSPGISSTWLCHSSVNRLR